MGYDNVILQTGNFGPYQRRIFSVLSLCAISWAFLKLGGVFLEAKPDFRCRLAHESSENATYQLIPPNITNTNYPWDYETRNWPKCERYDLDPVHSYNASRENVSSTPRTMKCDSFVHDKTHYTLTTVTEWNLVCDNAWVNAIGDSLFLLADLPGVLIFSRLSDRYGRKPILLLSVIMQFLCASLTALSSGFIMFTVFRVLLGMTMGGVYLVSYVTAPLIFFTLISLLNLELFSALEMAGPENRGFIGIAMYSCYIAGYIITGGLAYFIPNWRSLQIVFTIPSFAFIVFSRCVPESARWLLTKGRTEEAKNIIHTASLENGVELSLDTIDSLLEEKSESKLIIEKTSMLDILRYPRIRKNSLLLFVLWFVNSFTYYGLSLNTSNLGGNDYLNFISAAAVEVPAQGIVLLSMNRWGRRIIVCSMMCLSGISLLLTFFVPITGMSWLTVLLALMGKFTISISFATVYVFTSEQYPTAIRNFGVGACSSFGRLASVTAPYFGYLFEISTYVPLAILGFSAIVAGLLSLFLPETLNKKLSETVKEGEEFGKTKRTSEREIEELNDVDVTTLSK